MKGKLIWSIFWAMVAVFIIIICTMFVLVPIAGNLPLVNVFLPGVAVFLILGVALLVLTVKTKLAGLLKKFLLLTGASAVGLPVFAILHNLVYALLIYIFGENFWGVGGDEPFFFVIATIVCPLGFLVGAVGTIVLAIKNKLSVPAGTS